MSTKFLCNLRKEKKFDSAILFVINDLRGEDQFRKDA